MASTAHTDPDASPADRLANDRALQALARGVAALLGPAGLPGGEGLLSAGDVAARLGVRRGWVYDHADELGVVRLGDGPRPRLRFDPDALAQRVRRSRTWSGRVRQGPVPSARTVAAPGRSSSSVPLLPIKPPTRARGRRTVE
jgi:hypothetical protein